MHPKEMLNHERQLILLRLFISRDQLNKEEKKTLCSGLKYFINLITNRFYHKNLKIISQENDIILLDDNSIVLIIDTLKWMIGLSNEETENKMNEYKEKDPKGWFEFHYGMYKIVYILTRILKDIYGERKIPRKKDIIELFNNM